MNYFLMGIKDRRFWLRLIGVPLLAALIFMDILTYARNPPGVFGLWTVWLTIFGGGVFALYIAIRDTKRIRADRQEAARQKEFEARRIGELRRILADDPQFQTLCYCCRHYDQEKSTCALEIFNRQARHVNLDTPFRYCLYWEPIGSD
ncbi:MAG: hypothetical protein RB296_04030 [Acidobacteriota bacterium]|jgi:hypothetical protein|nr:hypothetical protein [Acidobacteriota bacterium]